MRCALTLSPTWFRDLGITVITDHGNNIFTELTFRAIFRAGFLHPLRDTRGLDQVKACIKTLDLTINQLSCLVTSQNRFHHKLTIKCGKDADLTQAFENENRHFHCAIFVLSFLRERERERENSVC